MNNLLSTLVLTNNNNSNTDQLIKKFINKSLIYKSFFAITLICLLAVGMYKLSATVLVLACIIQGIKKGYTFFKTFTDIDLSYSDIITELEIDWK